MEGTLPGSFELVCVCIRNGCFNSVQVICRERKVLKREHRSGLHMSSYIAAHMIYRALLCAAQADYNGLPMASGWNTPDSMLGSTIEFEFTTGQAIDAVNSSKNASVAELRNQELLPGLTVGSILENLGDTPGNKELRSHAIHPKFKLRDVVDFFGRDRVRDEIRARTGAAAFNARYDRSVDNVAECWTALAL